MKAEYIVEQLLEGSYHRRNVCPRGTTGRQIMESPQHYPGDLAYQKDSRFVPVSNRNFTDYVILGRDYAYTYVIDQQITTGFVFLNDDIEKKPTLGLVPVMTVLLRDSPVKGYKQAHKLRIRERYAVKGVATHWYLYYVEQLGGIASDFEHLDGGKRLWWSLVRTAKERGLKANLVDTTTGEETPVGAGTPESSIWSQDQALKHHVLVLEK